MQRESHRQDFTALVDVGNQVDDHVRLASQVPDVVELTFASSTRK